MYRELVAARTTDDDIIDGVIAIMMLMTTTTTMMMMMMMTTHSRQPLGLNISGIEQLSISTSLCLSLPYSGLLFLCLHISSNIRRMLLLVFLIILVLGHKIVLDAIPSLCLWQRPKSVNRLLFCRSHYTFHCAVLC